MAKRLLDIIVTHYNEPWNVYRPMLDMLRNQKMVDFSEFRVWLIQDGPVTNLVPIEYMKDAFSIYRDFLTIHVIRHAGVSAARNKGIDLADSEWIAFCDCDDCYTSVYSLYYIFHVLKSEEAKQFDLVWNPFYISPSNQETGILTQMDKFSPVFIHNKYYRLSFLREHNIRFPEHIYMSEDSAFNAVVKMELAPHKTGTVNSTEPLYAWCRRPGSITMDFSKWLHNTEGHFERNLYVIEECRKRNADHIERLIVRVITDAYSMLSRPDIPGDPTEFLKRLKQFYQENKEAYLSVPWYKVEEALGASDRDIGHSQKILNSRMPLNEWIKTYLED